MLKSYVSPKDYPAFIDILTRIHNDTLRDTTSLLLIKGGNSSGKSTIMKVIRRIAPTSFRRQFGHIGVDGCLQNTRRDDVTKWNVGLTDISPPDDKFDYDMYHKLTRYHEMQKETGLIDLFGMTDCRARFNPGVMVCCINTDYFPSESYDMTEFRKFKRMPIELNLPYTNTFKWDESTSLGSVDRCVEEFMSIINPPGESWKDIDTFSPNDICLEAGDLITQISVTTLPRRSDNRVTTTFTTGNPYDGVQGYNVLQFDTEEELIIALTKYVTNLHVPDEDDEIDRDGGDEDRDKKRCHGTRHVELFPDIPVIQPISAFFKGKQICRRCYIHNVRERQQQHNSHTVNIYISNSQFADVKIN